MFYIEFSLENADQVFKGLMTRRYDYLRGIFTFTTFFTVIF